MSDIIIKTLKSKLKELQEKRDKLDKEIHRDYISEVCQIRQEFKELLETDREAACKFAVENADKEKELLDKGIYVNENLFKMQDKLLEYDRQIMDLSQEISIKEYRNEM